MLLAKELLCCSQRVNGPSRPASGILAVVAFHQRAVPWLNVGHRPCTTVAGPTRAAIARRQATLAIAGRQATLAGLAVLHTTGYYQYSRIETEFQMVNEASTIPLNNCCISQHSELRMRADVSLVRLPTCGRPFLCQCFLRV